MTRLIEYWARLSFAKKATLGAGVILYTLGAYGVTVYLAFRNHPYFNTPERTNLSAIQLSLLSILSLAVLYWLVRNLMPAPAGDSSPPAETSLLPPKRIKAVGIALGLLFVAVCLPATFRAVSHPREVMIFWHDEGITLELVQAFVTGEKDVPDYRITQGWVTFLPVALALKALNCLVPVHYALTNVAMRCYQLTVIFFIVYFTYRLVFQITRAWWLATAVVLIAYTRVEFFHISLAIDRPDTFQLMFVLLSLIYAHRFWLVGQPRQWFLAVFFAAFAFASKYSGHLLTPVLLMAWIGYWRRPEVQSAYPTRWQYLRTGTALFTLSIGLIFPCTFVILSPYHLVKLNDVYLFFSQCLYIYKSGNVYNLPDYEIPSTSALWWNTFTSRFAFDYWLTVIGLASMAVTLVKNVIYRAKDARALGEWLLLAWGAVYVSFLLYQYALVDYRYIMPVQFVLPFFFMLPFLWVQKIKGFERIPYRTVLGGGVVLLVLFLCQKRVEGTRGFLAVFRSEKSAQASFDVGRYLDRMVPPDENPRILMTNLVYIPPRFTDLHVHNMDITPAFIDEHRFDYVIMTDNMYGIYADKPTAGFEQQFCPLYKVHYVEVVDIYTKFKHRAHPDYRYVTSFQHCHVFERIDRAPRNSQLSSSR